MASLKDKLLRGERLVLDGAMGSRLLEKGFSPGECLDLITLTHPEWVEQISAGYTQAGAEVIQTNTFGASPLRLTSFGLEDKMEELNRRAVLLAKKCAPPHGFVLGTIGPIARRIQPERSAELDTINDSFVSQIRVLCDAGVDGILIETMTDLGEALAALKAAREASAEIPVFVTVTFQEKEKGFLLGRDRLETVVRELEKAGADAVGSNCGKGIDEMVRVARDLVGLTTLPVIIQSSAGLPEVVDGRTVYPENPEFFEPRVRELVSMGVNIIGGCCGTTPDHIRVIRRCMDMVQ